jgi:uncharacterized protein
MIALRAALLTLLLVACSRPAQSTQPATTKPASSSIVAGQPQTGLAVGVVVIDTPAGGQRFDVDVAMTPAQTTHGLMFTTWMAPGRGMLFLFERERVQSFWMKNTLIPLDMVFINADLTIAGIVAHAEPKTTTPRKVDAPSRYVLELNAGVAEQSGLAPGQRVQFNGEAISTWLQEHP